MGRGHAARFRVIGACYEGSRMPILFVARARCRAPRPLFLELTFQLFRFIYGRGEGKAMRSMAEIWQRPTNRLPVELLNQS